MNTTSWLATSATRVSSPPARERWFGSARSNAARCVRGSPTTWPRSRPGCALRELSMSKREQLAQLMERSGLGWLLRKLPAWQGLLIINYHRIGDGSHSPFDRRVWSATPEWLDTQLRYFQ